MTNDEPSIQQADTLRAAHQRLLEHYGAQHWWPACADPAHTDVAPSADEIAIGAVLVQHTSWRNVERALRTLFEAGVRTLDDVRLLAESRLAELIHPAGPPRVKARRLLSLAEFAREQGGLDEYLRGAADRTVALTKRAELLQVHGVGPETADCVLLYAGGAPLAVVDAYLRRVLRRHGWLDAEASYDKLQAALNDVFGDDSHTHNEFHALVVRLGVDRCKARDARCDGCPLEPLLPEGGPCGG